jgi:hypothetical protein
MGRQHIAVPPPDVSVSGAPAASAVGRRAALRRLPKQAKQA